MSPTDTSVATKADTLSLVVVLKPGAQLKVRAFSAALQGLADLAAVATYFEEGSEGNERIFVELLSDPGGGSGHVEILRLSYASPVEIVLAVASGAAATRTGLQVLIYGVKRIYGIDLELVTYRAELRARFLEAKKHVYRLEADLLEFRARHVEALDAKEPVRGSELPSESPDWVKAVEQVEIMRTHELGSRLLKGESAVLSDDELG